MGSHPVLSELIKSFAIQRPVDRSLAPKWDLAFVLSHMCKAPFEPLDKASLFYLSVKTVFLVTLATARRVSEVHAFSIDSDHLRYRVRSAHLSPGLPTGLTRVNGGWVLKPYFGKSGEY